MKLLNPHNLWHVSNLPDGIFFKNGLFYGRPTTEGVFDVPVTVSNNLGSSSQTIRFIIKSRQLHASVQDETIDDNDTASVIP